MRFLQGLNEMMQVEHLSPIGAGRIQMVEMLFLKGVPVRFGVCVSTKVAVYGLEGSLSSGITQKIIIIIIPQDVLISLGHDPPISNYPFSCHLWAPDDTGSFCLFKPSADTRLVAFQPKCLMQKAKT